MAQMRHQPWHIALAGDVQHRAINQDADHNCSYSGDPAAGTRRPDRRNRSMSVTRLHHVNICTDDVAVSARYYAELLDLEARNAPGEYPADMVQWMYNESGQPVIHLFKQKRDQGSTGVIHHVALDCTGKEKILTRLNRLGAKYQTRQDERGAIIFMQDLHGVMLELYFPGE
jgi:Glyoxalase/Bleomycin resistance protein/Dioxygenase superfamily